MNLLFKVSLSILQPTASTDCFCYTTFQPLSIALACIAVYVRAGGSLGSLGRCLKRIESGLDGALEHCEIDLLLTGNIGRSHKEYNSVDGENTESQ